MTEYDRDLKAYAKKCARKYTPEEIDELNRETERIYQIFLDGSRKRPFYGSGSDGKTMKKGLGIWKKHR